MMTALIDVTMDRMEKEIKDEFDTIDNAARTALAFAKQTEQNSALTLMHRYAARHARDYHRALDKLRQIQSERRAPAPVPAEVLATSHELLATNSETGHRPPATDHCILQNEPKPPATGSKSTRLQLIPAPSDEKEPQDEPGSSPGGQEPQL